MPTYTVHARAGHLDHSVRANLARAITRAHTAATGAPGFFAQVVFHDIDPERHFVGGEPIADDLVFVHGQIRAGRTPEQKEALLGALNNAVQTVLGVPRRAVWVYLLELPPSDMVEYGYVLPAAGDEATWLASLDAETQRHLRSLGDAS
ncbi:MAG: tautomerase family protein [Corynebacterium sp.]|uniref:tautomerase family protein n=1 Tax=Corynebacterium sp. TaxID=1720 RepID=UPI0026DFF193|nr:tautomerase family protein [Corynebacterium sp.]MDO5669692.1 tautomerase family protein [Corynebacterium sp.]